MSTSDRDDMTTVVMACEEFMASTGIAPERLRELLALGWLESRTEGSDQFFRDADIYRVRKLERICCDFELPVVGGTIIVDLLERIDAGAQGARTAGIGRLIPCAGKPADTDPSRRPADPTRPCAAARTLRALWSPPPSACAARA